MSSLPDVSPRADRIIGQLQARLGEALGQIAILEDVNEQLRDQLIQLALPGAGDREKGAAGVD